MRVFFLNNNNNNTETLSSNYTHYAVVVVFFHTIFSLKQPFSPCSYLVGDNHCIDISAADPSVTGTWAPTA